MIDYSFGQPVRGYKGVTADYQEMNALVIRMRDIVTGPQIDDDTRKLVKTMNTVTNKKLSQQLQGL